MKRFFFDLHECGHGVVIDDEGAELPDIAAARGRAIHSAREVMAGEVMMGRLCLGCAIVIRNEEGETAMAVPFADALAVTFMESC